MTNFDAISMVIDDFKLQKIPNIKNIVKKYNVVSKAKVFFVMKASLKIICYSQMLKNQFFIKQINKF